MGHRTGLRTLTAISACIALVGCVLYLKPQCNDQILNGAESDVDCGGGTCRPCSVGQRCGAATDCESGVCPGDRCAPLPCENGVKDGAESDVDCGGPTCHACAGGRQCASGTDCANGQCSPATRTCAALTPLSFGPGTVYGTDYKPYVTMMVDVNRDGQLDLVVANEVGSSLMVYLNLGDGTLAAVPDKFPTGEYPTGAAVADFDRDGIPDVATANYHGNSVSVLLGVGDGSFRPATSQPTEAGAETSNLAVGDLDGDGVPDVVATNPALGSISVFLGRADGTLQPGTTLPVGVRGHSGPFSVAIADFDGDGRSDVAVADFQTSAMLVRLGNGDGTLGAESAYPIGGLGAFIVVAHDVNLDGRIDLVVANRGSDSVSVLLGRGDGTFRESIVSSTGEGTGPYALVLTDFNLDGVSDVATANYRSSTATVLLGIGDGRFEAPVDVGVMGTTSYGVAAGDLDGDGKSDLAVCNATSNDLMVRFNVSP